MLRSVKRQLIEFDGHTVVCGLTRSGKTWAVKESLRGQKSGTLFFNVQHELLPNDYIKAGSRDSRRAILRGLDKGCKINYIPSTDLDRQALELSCLIEMLYDGLKRDVILVVDEVHLFTGKDVKRQLIRVATTGLRYGIRGVWISQRPANIQNTLMTQSNKFVFFKMNMEYQYLAGHGIPGERIGEVVKQGGKYAYCTFDWGDISGPFRV